MAKKLGSDLATSRILRLLRPLQTKCKVLASSAETSGSKSRGSVAATYASSSRDSTAISASDVPLAIIPPPEKLRALFHLDKASRANITLSKMLYDVRDAFRNILQAVITNPSSLAGDSVDASETKPPFCSLAAVCAAIVGNTIEAEIADSRDERDAEEFAEDEDMEILNEYYDAVPGHYRRFARKYLYWLTFLTCFIQIHCRCACPFNYLEDMPAPPHPDLRSTGRDVVLRSQAGV